MRVFLLFFFLILPTTGLYNGVGVVVIRAFPANAALFLGYELTSEQCFILFHISFNLSLFHA